MNKRKRNGRSGPARSSPASTRGPLGPWASDGDRYQSFLANQRLEFKRCLEPSWQCQEEAIRSHSIQNSRVLELLQQNNHVVAPAMRTSMASGPQIDFRLVGRNKASTFTGLCASHDNQIFEPIEKNAVNLHDPEHLFLLAYRAATRELHAHMATAIRFQAGYQERIDRGLDSPDKPSPVGREATIRLLMAHDTFRHRSFLDEWLMNRDFGALEHDVFMREVAQPTIAVSSLFSLDSLAKGRDVPLVHLNVIPLSQTEIGLVFSYTPAHARAVRDHLRPVLTSSGREQLLEVSRLVLEHCENFLLSPAYFEKWSAKKRLTVLAYFVGTMARGEVAADREQLLLF